MCRWMAYSGKPILADDLLFRPKHSIIDQSLHAELGTGVTTNGDGFGIGWYGDGDGEAAPAVFKGTHPAWNDENLREIATQIRTPLLFAHVRASSGTPVQRSNCHPFRYGRWLWMHNGSLAGFADVRRDLLMAVDPSLYPTDPGIDRHRDPVLPGPHLRPDRGSARRGGPRGRVRRAGRPAARIEYPVHMTVATSDGESIWVFRYSSEKATSSLYYSTDVSQVRQPVPGAGGPRPAGARHPLHRLRTAARPPRRLERGPRGLLGAHPGALLPDSAVRADRIAAPVSSQATPQSGEPRVAFGFLW